MFENQELKLVNKVVFLIGFMGAGKSTIGKKLAEKLNYDFLDSDLAIENQQGMTVNSIFSGKGESFFRELESLFIEGLKEKKNMIIATGGGLPCFNNNMDKMKEIGLVIYLKASPQIIFNRILNNESRPLLKNLSFEPKYASCT